jgi:hypothetical protein
MALKVGLSSVSQSDVFRRELGTLWRFFAAVKRELADAALTIWLREMRRQRKPTQNGAEAFVAELLVQRGRQSF